MKNNEIKNNEILHDDFFESLYELAEEIEAEKEKAENTKKHLAE